MKLYPHLQKFPGNFLISPQRWKQKEELFIEKATKVVTVSQEFVDEVLSRTGIDQNKIVLVPNTVRASFYKDAVYEQELLDRFDGHFVLLYLGDTHLRRGLQTAIAALPALSEQIPSILLVVVGTNTTDPVLKKQVSDLGMEDFVSFEGWKNVSLFPTYIKSSSLCLSPLHRNKHHDVAYANKIFQYMSLGKPLLVSDAIAQKKLIERTQSGWVHRERDVEDFIEKTRLLAANKKLRTQMGANGKAFIETEFSWEKTSKNLVHLYDNLNR
jgi:glycosyltransferase involved in cell wall biosynthesis